MKEYQAIGVIEARYYTTALDIIDIMCKECEVDFLNAEKYLGGRLVTVIVGGSVSNVTQAVEEVRYKYGNDRSILKNSLVITRPHSEILKFIVKQEESIVEEVTNKLEETASNESNPVILEDKLEDEVNNVEVVGKVEVKPSSNKLPVKNAEASQIKTNDEKKDKSVKAKKNKNKSKKS